MSISHKILHFLPSCFIYHYLPRPSVSPMSIVIVFMPCLKRSCIALLVLPSSCVWLHLLLSIQFLGSIFTTGFDCLNWLITPFWVCLFFLAESIVCLFNFASMSCIFHLWVTCQPLACLPVSMHLSFNALCSANWSFKTVHPNNVAEGFLVNVSTGIFLLSVQPSTCVKGVWQICKIIWSYHL